MILALFSVFFTVEKNIFSFSIIYVIFYLVIEKICFHRFGSIFRRHVNPWPHWVISELFLWSSFYYAKLYLDKLIKLLKTHVIINRKKLRNFTNFNRFIVMRYTKTSIFLVSISKYFHVLYKSWLSNEN